MKKRVVIIVAALLLAVAIIVGAVFLLPSGDETANGTQNTKGYNTVPIIYIQTQDLSEIPDDKTQVPCTVTLEKGEEKCFVTDLPATVRTRGNGSLEVGKNYGKMPYKIKFDKKINLFGTQSGESRDWVLIANMSDYTMLRNFAAKRLGSMLEGIPYSTASIPVSLYVNNQYVGVYELTDQIEVTKNRVPVDDTSLGEQNGFLVELDRYAINAEEGDVTFSVGKNYYTVKSKVANDAQLEYIKSTISEVESAIYSGDRDRIAELVDMNSLIDTYILQEYSKNIDAGFSSFYMYMDVGGKLIFAPPWDFDLAFGNDYRLDNGSPEELYVATGRKGFSQNHLWYMELYKTKWFKAETAARWQEVSSVHIPTLIEEVSDVSKVLAPDMETNFTKWPREEGQRYQLEPDHIVAMTDYEEYVDHLIGWMKARKDFLDSEFK